jgi:hypothetical protein
MRKLVLVVITAVLVTAIGLGVSRSASKAATPETAQFNSDGTLVRPEGYRRWVYVSSGFGMSYSPDAGGNGAPAFTNVFVNPASYEYFQANGKWPDKTVFVLEVYSSSSHGSINKSGSFQSSLQGLDVEVKDETRFPDKWAYFGFGANDKSAKATTPGKNDCWKCHDQNAAVEHSFVQFYPELLKVAHDKGTIKSSVHLGQ